MLDELRLHRFTFSNTGVLAAAGATAWTSGGELTFGSDAVLGLLVRSTLDRVLVVRTKDSFNSQLCPYRLGTDGAFAPESTPCQSLPGTPVGLEEGVLWTRVGQPFQATGQTLRRWTFSGTTVAEAGTLALDAPVEGVFASLRPGFVLPDIRLGGSASSVLPVVYPEQSPLGLELLPNGSTAPRELRAMSSRFYWEGDARLNNGSTLVYERPAG